MGVDFWVTHTDTTVNVLSETISNDGLQPVVLNIAGLGLEGYTIASVSSSEISASENQEEDASADDNADDTSAPVTETETSTSENQEEDTGADDNTEDMSAPPNSTDTTGPLFSDFSIIENTASSDHGTCSLQNERYQRN